MRKLEPKFHHALIACRASQTLRILPNQQLSNGDYQYRASESLKGFGLQPIDARLVVGSAENLTMDDSVPSSTPYQTSEVPVARGGAVDDNQATMTTSHRLAKWFQLSLNREYQKLLASCLWGLKWLHCLDRPILSQMADAGGLSLMESLQR